MIEDVEQIVKDALAERDICGRDPFHELRAATYKVPRKRIAGIVFNEAEFRSRVAALELGWPDHPHLSYFDALEFRGIPITLEDDQVGFRLIVLPTA